MPGRRQLLLVLAGVLLFGMAGAWWMLQGPGAERRGAELHDNLARRQGNDGALNFGPAGGNSGTSADGDHAASHDGTAVSPPVDTGLTDTPNRGHKGAAADAGKGAAPGPSRERGRSPTGKKQPGADKTSGQPAKPRGLPNSSRDPTPREATAHRRYSEGAFRKVSIPKAAGGDEKSPLDLSKLAEQDVWIEYWSRQGYMPPAMVKTPVHGKLMSLLDNNGLAKATVRVFTFFPVAGLSGSLLPVAMEATTDARGFFSINLPTPKAWPSGYPKYAVSAEAGGLRVVDAAVFDSLRAGEQNELGVFWTPEEPYEVEVKVTNAEQGLSAVATGRLDPRRWEHRRARQILPLFGPEPLDAAGSKLHGTWDYLKTDDLPYVTLLRNGEPVLTRQCSAAMQVTSGGLEIGGDLKVGTPFEAVVFTNDGYLTLAGTVVDGTGTPVEGATLTLPVKGNERVAFSDASGWFSFDGLPEGNLTLTVNHDAYVPRGVVVTPGKQDTRVVLKYPRPDVTLHVVSALDATAVAEIWLDGMEAADPYATEFDEPKLTNLPTRHLQSADGNYPFQNEHPVSLLTVQAPGFKPRLISLEGHARGDVIEVKLAAGLKLERKGRDYSAVQTESLWHKDDNGGPGLWSLDDDHWVEYSFDFGQDPANCDLLLGVTNHTYGTLPLDNEYQFDVDVYLDGNKLDTLHIGSDPQVAQIGRINLGTLQGTHTLRLIWTNDRYIPGQLDANIRYESLRIIEVFGFGK